MVCLDRLESMRPECKHGGCVAASMRKNGQNGSCAQRAGRLHKGGGKRGASARTICPDRCRCTRRREPAVATFWGSSRRTRLRSHRGGGARDNQREASRANLHFSLNGARKCRGGPGFFFHPCQSDRQFDVSARNWPI